MYIFTWKWEGNIITRYIFIHDIVCKYSFYSKYLTDSQHDPVSSHTAGHNEDMHDTGFVWRKHESTFKIILL
jgi:hypothetical protein